MKHLQQHILLYCLAACNIAIFTMICMLAFGNTLKNYYLLLIFLVIVLVFLSYLYWLTKHSTSVLLLSDAHSDSEKLINSCDASLLGEELASQIIPSALLQQDSPRTRLQLKRLKGSFFKPPRIVIVLNLQHLLNSNEGELLLLTTNLNRVLFLLRHARRTQQVDVVFNHLEKLSGYREFVTQADGISEYSATQSIAQQLGAQQNSTKALLAYSPEDFMLYLAFTHSISTISAVIEKLLNDLLLSDKKANARVFIRA